MLEISPKSNLLEQKSYKYSLQDIPEPNLYREVYNYEEVPKVPSTTAACRSVCLQRYG